VEGKDKNEILAALVDTAEPGSRAHEQQKMGIIVRCTEDLEKALGTLGKMINDNAQARDKGLLVERNPRNRNCFWHYGSHSTTFHFEMR
jgi:hypothetical protein